MGVVCFNISKYLIHVQIQNASKKSIMFFSNDNTNMYNVYKIWVGQDIICTQVWR